MPILFDCYNEEEIENYVYEIEARIRKGYERKKIEKEIHLECFEEIFDIAKARMKNDKTKEKLYMNLEDLRFATHKDVADYRASRLKCKVIVDACCGIGIQSIAFSKTCSKVIAIEVDERKARYALENFKKLGIKNVELIKGDAVKASKVIRKADIVFCDTERAAEEPERSLSRLKPDVKQLIRAYSHLTKNICVEVPPRIRSIPLGCEKEYLSLNGKLNRLNLYFGELMKAEFSATALPGGFRVEGEQGRLPKTAKTALSYLYEADEAVVTAGLLSKVVPKNVLLYTAEKQTLLTSDKHVKNVFFSKSYKILGKCKPSYNEVIDALNKVGGGSVVLRARIKPEDYWAEKKKYESRLKGNKKLYLFITNRDALIAEPVNQTEG